MKPPVRILSIVVPLVAVAFVGAHAATRRAAMTVRARTLEVQRLAAATAVLTATREDLHLVRTAVRDAVLDGEDLDAAELAVWRASLHDDLVALRAAPVDGAGGVAFAVAAADDAFARAAAIYLAGDAAAARAVDLKSFSRRADELLAHASTDVAKRSDREAGALVALHTRLRTLSTLYDCIAGLFALTLLGFSVYSARRYAVLVDERQREAERRADELELFAGRVAHDIRNPLTALALHIGLIRRGDGGGDGVQRRVGALDGFVRRINEIIDGLLAFARAGGVPDDGASADVALVVDGVLRDFVAEAEACGIELVVGPVAPAAVRCANGPLASILENLVRNAIKHLGRRDERRVRVEARVIAGGAVRFEVEDTGPGIPADRREAIFQPFVRVGDGSVPGIGLGLATVKRLVEAHAGRVGVEAAGGGGARFWFELPGAPSRRRPPIPGMVSSVPS